MTAFKKIFRASLCLLMPLTVAAQKDSAHFIQGEFKTVQARARAENKPIFVDLYFVGCIPCKRMEDETFKDKEVAEYLNKNFICYKSDINKEKDGKELSRKYGASGFPHYLYIMPDGRLIESGLGFSGARRFPEALKQIDANGKAGKVKKFSTAMNLTYPQVYNDLYDKAPAAQSPDRKKLINDWMAQQQDLSSEVSYLMMIRGMGLLEDKYVHYFIDHVQQLANDYGQRQVATSVYKKVSQRAGELGAKKDKAGFDALIRNVKPVYTENEWRIFGKIIQEPYYRAAGDENAFVDYVNDAGYYAVMEKAQLAVKSLPAAKSQRDALARMGAWLTDAEINKEKSGLVKQGLLYVRASMEYYLGANDLAKQSLDKALVLGGEKPANKQLVDNLSAAIAAGKTDYKVKMPLFPMVMNEE
ncbi:thioredoxin domain-containing protein [Chitinophaga sedimenti]|uniref:thioredoxin family protein n=1 Tax=Chitinophaga sedimenti TaxID=2033606 RepID=UPI002004E37D|nr:DUF255 domain-containing protein [Chitinophaga sedimenti]MCK7555337.1 thioredoxin domain-containing protein [Chitinophaga sedimenti]